MLLYTLNLTTVWQFDLEGNDRPAACILMLSFVLLLYNFVLYIWSPVNPKICISFICRNLVLGKQSTLFSILIYIGPVSLMTLQMSHECAWHWCCVTRLCDQFAWFSRVQTVFVWIFLFIKHFGRLKLDVWNILICWSARLSFEL